MSTCGTENPQTGTMDLKTKLNKLRIERGPENISEISRRARVPKTSCYRWFEGSAYPEIREAHRLAQLWNVPLEYLADESIEEPPAPSLTEAEHAIVTLVRVKGLTLHAAMERLDLDDEALRRLVTPVGELPAYRPGPARWIGPQRDETEADLRRQQEAREPKRVERPTKPEVRQGNGGPSAPKGGTKGSEGKR